MPAGPNGPGPRKPGGQGKRPGISTPAWLQSTGNTPPHRPNAAPARGARGGTTSSRDGSPLELVKGMATRLMAHRHVRLGFIAAVVLTVGFTGWSLFYGPPTSCRRTPARKQAVQMLLTSADPVTKAPLSERFSRGDFRCANLAATDVAPGGVLVETHDGSDPVTWFFDDEGTPFNVNQLAAAWTPQFEASPRITTEQLAAVRD